MAVVSPSGALVEAAVDGCSAVHPVLRGQGGSEGFGAATEKSAPNWQASRKASRERWHLDLEECAASRQVEKPGQYRLLFMEACLQMMK